MVDDKRDRDRTSEESEDMGALQADPTLDIVRQLIVEAEAIPAPARRPAGPATPRPGAGGPPAAGRTPVVRSDVAPDVEPVEAPRADPARVPDALSEAWDDDPTDDDGDDFAPGEVSRPYGIVDLETGEVVALEGAEPDAQTTAAPAAPAARRRVRRGQGGRWLGGVVRGALRGLGRLLGSTVRALAGLVGAGLRVVARAAARFLKRPDAPRRLAVALLVIFLIAWPLKVLWLTLLIPLAGIITWASVGNEGSVELVARWYERLRARDPDKAERIRRRAAAVTRGLNHGLERLPQRWTQGLYLPDFETDGYVPDKLKVDPFEELAARVHSAKRAEGH